MNLLSWNARGLGDPRAVDKLRMLIRKSSPSLVFISETKLAGRAALVIKERVGFSSSIQVDSTGRSGGLLLMWNDDLEVSLKSFSSHHIDIDVTDGRGLQWRYTGVYGEPIRGQRWQFWELLRRLQMVNSLPWLVSGDFNEIVSLIEKK